MKFSELKECPFCGSEEFYVKQHSYGYIPYRFNGEEMDASDTYDCLSRKQSDKCYCKNCHKYLGNIKTNVASKEAEGELARSREIKNFTDKDKMLAKTYRDEGYKWIARDKYNQLYIYFVKPYKMVTMYHEDVYKEVDEHNFDPVQFSDSEPTRLDDIIGEEK